MKLRTTAAVFTLAAAFSFGAEPRSFLGRDYPMEVVVSYPAALFHWIDSLAGTSGGKTIPAYQREYARRFGGEPSGRDEEVLLEFRQARSRLFREDREGYSELLRAFCRAETVSSALAWIGDRLGEDDERIVRTALDRYRERYDDIWRDGEIPIRFLRSARYDPARKRLGRLLSDISRFVGVDPSVAPERPRIVLVPVPRGFGTHAEAIGNTLLIEIPPGDVLPDQASVIVHENAHFLVGLIDEDRRARLETGMRARGPRGEQAWKLLHEALPTALGQGVADRMFRPEVWSLETPWYHTASVDAYAKALYPLVVRALRDKTTLDREFVRRALERFPG